MSKRPVNNNNNNNIRTRKRLCANGNNTCNQNMVAFVSRVIQDRNNINVLNRKSFQTAVMFHNNNTIVTPYQGVLLQRFVKLITIFGCRAGRFQSVGVRNDPHFYFPLMQHIENVIGALPTDVTILKNYLFVMLSAQSNTAFHMNKALCRKYAGIIVSVQKNGNRFMKYDGSATSVWSAVRATRLFNDVKEVVTDVQSIISASFNREVVRVWTEYQRIIGDIDLLLQTIDMHPFPHQLGPILNNVV